MKLILATLLLLTACVSMPTKFLATSPPTCTSPNGATLPAPGQLCDGTNTWSLTNGVVLMNGANAGYTANVILLLYWNGQIYQENASLGFWKWQSGSWVGTTDPRVPQPASGFHVANGQIIDPNGKVFVAHGIDCGPQDMNSAAQMLTLFPKLNFIRLAIPNNFPAPSTLQAFVTLMTSKGIVVEIEDHAWPSPLPYTGQQLTTESNWYASLATAFKSNPYVWFGTMNEPGDSGTYQGTGAGISAQHLATYLAIRGAGNNTILMMDYFGGGNPGSVGAGFGLTTSTYAAMKNVVWDLHFYGWSSNFSTDQNVVNANLAGSVSGGYGIAAAQTIKSADGTVPVLIGEFGDSTTGSSVDANANQVIQAVLTSGTGYAAWTWGAQGGPDQLTQNGVLTGFGQAVANGINK